MSRYWIGFWTGAATMSVLWTIYDRVMTALNRKQKELEAEIAELENRGVTDTAVPISDEMRAIEAFIQRTDPYRHIFEQRTDGNCARCGRDPLVSDHWPPTRGERDAFHAAQASEKREGDQSELVERLRALGTCKRVANSDRDAAAARNVYRVNAEAFDWDAAADRIESLSARIAQLTEALRAAKTEIDRWGHGDFHYGATPRDVGVLAALAAIDAALEGEQADEPT